MEKKYSERLYTLDEARVIDPNLTKGLSWRQIHCLELLVEWCDWFHFTTEGKKFWKFYFDDGAYKGGWTFEKRQKDIGPNLVCYVAESVGWPGLKGFLYKVEEATLEIIERELKET